MNRRVINEAETEARASAGYGRGNDYAYYGQGIESAEEIRRWLAELLEAFDKARGVTDVPDDGGSELVAEHGPVDAPRMTAASSKKGGPTAAAQLLQLVQNRDFFNCLLALVQGSPGCRFIRGGSRGLALPVGQILDLLSTVGSKAAADTDELLSENYEGAAYLHDNESDLQVDRAVSEDRVLWRAETLSGVENQRPASEMAHHRPWAPCFPFAKGTRFVVAYETWAGDWNVGNGAVIELASNLLRLTFHIDKWDKFNVPETAIIMEIEYSKEGTGNQADIVVNGIRYTDKAVAIHSRGRSRQIFTSTRILGQKVDRITVTKEKSDEVKLILGAGDEEHVLILTKSQD
jgi:hypothetical protein